MKPRMFSWSIMTCRNDTMTHSPSIISALSEWRRYENEKRKRESEEKPMSDVRWELFDSHEHTHGTRRCERAILPLRARNMDKWNQRSFKFGAKWCDHKLVFSTVYTYEAAVPPHQAANIDACLWIVMNGVLTYSVLRVAHQQTQCDWVNEWIKRKLIAILYFVTHSLTHTLVSRLGLGHATLCAIECASSSFPSFPTIDLILACTHNLRECANMNQIENRWVWLSKISIKYSFVWQVWQWNNG